MPLDSNVTTMSRAYSVGFGDGKDMKCEAPIKRDDESCVDLYYRIGYNDGVMFALTRAHREQKKEGGDFGIQDI